MRAELRDERRARRSWETRGQRSGWRNKQEKSRTGRDVRDVPSSPVAARLPAQPSWPPPFFSADSER